VPAPGCIVIKPVPVKVVEAPSRVILVSAIDTDVELISNGAVESTVSVLDALVNIKAPLPARTPESLNWN